MCYFALFRQEFAIILLYKLDFAALSKNQHFGLGEDAGGELQGLHRHALTKKRLSGIRKGGFSCIGYAVFKVKDTLITNLSKRVEFVL